MINIRQNTRPKVRKSKIRILHLEDNESDAELISHLLTRANLDFETQVVDNREQYQKALIDFLPEIIISDHSLPAFNSLEALNILKLSGRKIPFMLVTGAVSEEFAIRAMQEGADDYILKDRMQRLPVAVTAILEKYAQERDEYAKDALLRNIDINSLDMICSIDEDGRFVHISAASKAILDYEPSELHGRKYIELVHEDDLAASIKIATEIKCGKPVKFYENRFHRKNGSLVSILWSARWDEIERIMYCVGKDVTERKKIEMETLSMIDLLQFKNKELKQFAYMVSHNLRAPIARILGLASVFGKDTTENIFILEKIKEATTDLDNVVKDINLVVSARNSEDLKMEYVDFQTQMELIMQVHEKEIAECKGTVEIDFCRARGLVTMPSYIYSIMQNLFSNAIKYRLNTIPLHINIVSSKDEKFTCLSVKDNGMGIDLARNSEKLFGLYKRFHGNTIPGKGVGLHLVKTHAESLGGRVEVESEIDKGIEFKIYLPNDKD